MNSMSLSSSQIAQLNGSFAAQYLQQQQFANTLQQQYNFGGMNTGAQNEGMAGRGLNAAAAVGAPMATLGLGLLGLDPISMGVRSGMAAGGIGGMGAGLAVGAGVAGVGMLGMGALGYMGNQMMQGAQQTQQFNQNMRAGYSFFNTTGDHGRGFADQDIRQIGGNIRSMASGHMGGSFGGTASQFELGPSFNELGRLAANMGRMGLADGVRNAKEFTEKFREMVKSVKTIAEDMGTTLEEAQKTMAAMKGSGIFKHQSGVSGAIRAASVSGGLATTEVTGMMNIGSQVSRMFGGTGRQGAMGGIRAIEQVGSAQQMGILSEEDIYQATGLSGAEGRQAMAQQNMVQTGSFLKSSKGRGLLASLAGKNGKLDERSINDFMTGGMGVNDMRNAAHRNLVGVGRANFIRNEGRLRGAVMEEFGGLAPAMAMMSWAQGKGIDINSMGDREMLFMQRQMGLGRDEADSLVKMARRMPELLQHQREMKTEDTFSREHGMRAQNSGIEGIKRKLEAAKNSVNNEMQKVGQHVLNSATDAIAEWGNKLAGTYEEHSIAGLQDFKRSVLAGGKIGAAQMASISGFSNLGSALTAGGGGLSMPHEDVGQRALIDRTQKLQFAARMATVGGLDAGLQKIIQSNSSGIIASYANGLSSLGGEDRISAFGRSISDPAFKQKWKSMSASNRAAVVQQAEGQLGITNRLSESDWGVPKLPELVGGGDIRTEAGRNEALGRAASGLGHTGAGKVMGRMGEGLGSLLDMTGLTSNAAAIGKRAGTAYGNAQQRVADRADAGWGERALTGLFESISGNKDTAEATGAFLRSDEGRRLSYAVLSGATGATDSVNLMLANADKSDTGTIEGLHDLQDAAGVMKYVNADGGFDKLSSFSKNKIVNEAKNAARRRNPNITDEELQNINFESVASKFRGVAQGAAKEQAAMMSKLREQVGRTSTEEMQFLSAGGTARLLDNGGIALTKETENALMKSGGKGVLQAAQQAIAVENADRLFGADKLSGTDWEKARSDFSDTLAGMSVSDMKKLAPSLAGTAAGTQITADIMRQGAMDASKRKRGGSGASAVAAQLGIELSADEMAKLAKMGDKDASTYLARKAGVSGDKDFVEGIADTIMHAGMKGSRGAGEALTRARAHASQDTLDKLSGKKESETDKIISKLAESNTHLAVLAKAADRDGKILAGIQHNTNETTKKDGEAHK